MLNDALELDLDRSNRLDGGTVKCFSVYSFRVGPSRSDNNRT